jgi:hypothetical protein
MSSILRQRLISLFFVLPLLAGLCIAAYMFGPSPSRIVRQETAAAAPIVSTASVAAAPAESRQIFELFGMYQTAVASGKAVVTPAEFLNALEERYRQRGYRKMDEFDPGLKVTSKKRSRRNAREPIKFFQRDYGNGIANISATGEDADLDSGESAREPYTFSTLVASAAGGGTDWATYRIQIDRQKLAQLGQLDSADFPGNDPAGVPRPPGVQRVYALSSGTASLAIYKSTDRPNTALITHYFEEMPHYGWQLDSGATSAANEIVSGVMCFTRRGRSCLVWITQGKEPNTISITVSSH